MNECLHVDAKKPTIGNVRLTLEEVTGAGLVGLVGLRVDVIGDDERILAHVSKVVLRTGDTLTLK